MVSNRTLIKNLQTAINNLGDKILINRQEFYSDEQKRVVTSYTIKRQIAYKKSNTLFTTYSPIQVVLYLRDLLFQMQGRELPTDNEMWNDIRNNITNGIINVK